MSEKCLKSVEIDTFSDHFLRPDRERHRGKLKKVSRKGVEKVSKSDTISDTEIHSFGFLWVPKVVEMVSKSDHF